MKRIAIVIALFLGFIVGAMIPTTADAEQNYPLKIWAQNQNGKFETLNVVDSDTGVNYIVVSEEYGSNVGIAICPRYNADGSLYISK